MGLSKEHRIMILLGIDGVFFLIELVVGYAVHSLALVADAFHMLNDVLSLCVGLWAVRVANTESSEKYTYGWQRAETLGALVNGVFLVALCMSIFLEAIQRFVEPQVVSNPKLVFIVGCLGLASNILGLFLFHDHSHGHDHTHDEEGHSHNVIKRAEEGHAHLHSIDDEHHERTPLIAGENGIKKAGTNSDIENTTLTAWSSHSHKRRSTANSGVAAAGHHRRRTSAFGSADDIPVHPASMRQGIFRAAQFEGLSSDADSEEAVVEPQQQIAQNGFAHDHQHEANFRGNGKQSHANHFHAQPKSKQSGGGVGGHGHSHDDLNMRGVFLHVLGDALGNIGVIATALFIWLTDWSFRYYFDPAISLLITVIILCSAIPLCKAASRILLQATPESISIEEIRQDIETLDGVDSAHHLHVWQLSDTKLVASLHVKVNCEIQGAGSEAYMHLAREIQQCLHGYGIHSSTIQPEFIPEADSYEHGGSSQSLADHTSRGGNSKTPSMASLKGQACMLDCEEECSPKKKCCPTTATSQEIQGHGGTSKGGASHSHGQGHTH